MFKIDLCHNGVTFCPLNRYTVSMHSVNYVVIFCQMWPRIHTFHTPHINLKTSPCWIKHINYQIDLLVWSRCIDNIEFIYITVNVSYNTHIFVITHLIITWRINPDNFLYSVSRDDRLVRLGRDFYHRI